jgi:hypothetical protein
MVVPTIDNIPLVQISTEGIFKYILIQVYIGNKFTGYLIRGSTEFEYHKQIYLCFRDELKKLGFKELTFKTKEITAKKGMKSFQFVCPGGGRIEHNYQGIKCSIYGRSKTYGTVNHQKAQELITRVLGYPK